jgi:uncharacterized metal-binding protein
MGKDRTVFPLLYSCSGCSSAAQMANHIALELDRRDVAEMSCIAGVGGDVPSLVKLARSGRPVVAVDGCPLACARNCLARHGVAPDLHWQLAEHGVRKRYHAQFDPLEAAVLLDEVADEVAALAADRALLQPV